MRLLIKNGIIVTASDVFKGDIFIDNEIIQEIAVNISREADKIIDAEGNYIIPGGVDVHTHFNLDIGTTIAKDDFYSGTIAAACGGTTTVIDHMGFGPSGCNLMHQLNKYHKYADSKAVIDYSFHGVIQHVNEEILQEVNKLVEEEGITSFKIYLTYDYKIEDEDVIKVMKQLTKLNAITTVHCENHGIIKYLREYYIKNNMKTPKYHSLSRPKESEGEAVNRMINIAKISNNTSVYIVHLSSTNGLAPIKNAREEGQKIYAETCPQYLILDKSKYDIPNNEGLKYILSPPLRDREDCENLWKGINDGYIQTIATDHCPFTFNEQKQLGKDDFTKCPNGIPGVEERIPLIFSEGVMKNRISINKFVEVCCTNQAKIFGVYPKKGTIQIGSDADLVIINPEKEVILTSSNLHSKCDYTPYEGMKLKGYPIATISRGKIVYKHGEFVGMKGYGEFIKRKKSN